MDYLILNCHVAPRSIYLKLMTQESSISCCFWLSINFHMVKIQCISEQHTFTHSKLLSLYVYRLSGGNKIHLRIKVLDKRSGLASKWKHTNKYFSWAFPPDQFCIYSILTAVYVCLYLLYIYTSILTLYDCVWQRLISQFSVWRLCTRHETLSNELLWFHNFIFLRIRTLA